MHESSTCIYILHHYAELSSRPRYIKTDIALLVSEIEEVVEDKEHVRREKSL